MAEDGFRNDSVNLWKQALNEILSGGVPASAKWTDIGRMSAVLAVVGSQQNSNHMFFPTGGGFDLGGAAFYKEEPGLPCSECWRPNPGSRKALCFVL